MGACADRPDDAAAFQILRVLQNVRLERRRIVRRRIDEEEHAEVDVVGSETAKQRFEVASANGRIAADVVLLVQVHRADVPLNHHPVAPSGEGPADVRTHLLTGHEEVHEIDAVVQCRVDRFFDDGVRFAVEMFASEADHAGLQSGSADLTIFHDRAPLNWKVSCFPGTVCSGTQYNTHSGRRQRRSANFGEREGKECPPGVCGEEIPAAFPGAVVKISRRSSGVAIKTAADGENGICLVAVFSNEKSVFFRIGT